MGFFFDYSRFKVVGCDIFTRLIDLLIVINFFLSIFPGHHGRQARASDAGMHSGEATILKQRARTARSFCFIDERRSIHANVTPTTFFVKEALYVHSETPLLETRKRAISNTYLDINAIDDQIRLLRFRFTICNLPRVAPKLQCSVERN